MGSASALSLRALYEWAFREVLAGFRWPTLRIDAFVCGYGWGLAEPSALLFAWSPMSHVAEALLMPEFSDLRLGRNEKLRVLDALARELERVTRWEEVRRARRLPPPIDWERAVPEIRARVEALGGVFRAPPPPALVRFTRCSA